MAEGVSRRGNLRATFTLLELLVVVAVVAALTALLLPSFSYTRELARSTVCFNNIRQMLLAVQNYLCISDGRFPVAVWQGSLSGRTGSFAWDFFFFYDEKGSLCILPGWLWLSVPTIDRVQQCPSFDRSLNTWSRPYTGYNYNVDYIGGQGGMLAFIPTASISSVGQPSRTAIFGDGQYYNGANNYMRGPEDVHNLYAADAGTQGYRHVGRTNVGFVDGHCQTIGNRFTCGYPRLEATDDCGFISPDDSLYDLD